jgi:glycosyltransferase involved in cell wall biosynthesis
MTGNIGGLETFIMNYYRNINPQKIRFDFLCVNQRPAFYQEIIDNGSKVYVVPGRRKIITQYRKLASIFKENRYDGFWSNRCSLSGTSVFFKIASKYEVPLRIIHAHNTGIAEGGNAHQFCGKLLHIIEKSRIEKSATDFWACSSEAGKFNFTRKILQLATFRLVHNAIDSDKFKFQKNICDNAREELLLNNRLTIGHIGRFSFQKNHNFLIRVFHEIYKKEPNAILLLVGNGKLRPKIETMVNSLGLNEAVRFLGVRYDIPNLLSAMDLFLLPSKFEGLGTVLIEAQATSLRSFASTNVPSEVAVTDLLSFVDLQKTPKEWANIILSKSNYNKIDMTEKIREAAYDIKAEAAELEQYLLKRIEHINGK